MLKYRKIEEQMMEKRVIKGHQGNNHNDLKKVQIAFAYIILASL